MNIPHLEPRLTSIPEVPKTFGEDGGNFYRYYDALADELDEDMVKSLKSQLDGILIFAGLFAGVNSAFLALTLPDMKADPADDTNALLLQLVTGGNSTIRSADDLPSATFTPSANIFPINVLFSLSLTLAIISSFLAVLGQQWLVYYRKRSGGGAEYQRWEQLRRYLGAKRWRLEAILDDILPVLLQSSLVIFCVALAFYLRTLSETICYIIATPMVVAVTILFLVAIAASWDKWCPFKSPLSHFLQIIGQFIRNHWPLYYLVLALISIPYFLSVLVTGIMSQAKEIIRTAENFGTEYLGNRSRVPRSLLKFCKTHLEELFEDVELAVAPWSGEGATYLKAVAAKRMLCTSEDFNALIFTAINIQAIAEREGTHYLLDDDTVHGRFYELCQSPEAALASVFSDTFPHLLLRSSSATLFVERDTRPLYAKDTLFPKMHEYASEDHPLKMTVSEFLDLLLTPNTDHRDFRSWVDDFVENQPASKLANQTIIKFVACAIIEVQPWPSLARGPIGEGHWNPSSFVVRPYEREANFRERYLAVQQQRVEIFKMLINVDWETLARSTCSQTIAVPICSYVWKWPRCPNKLDVWILDQLLLMLTDKPEERGWEDVAGAAINLLCWFDKFEDTVANSITTQAARKDNRLRCTRALFKCLQALTDDALLSVCSSLVDKMVEHLERLLGLSLDQSADSYHVPILASWLEIRDTLGEPSKYKVPVGQLQPQFFEQFASAYPRLKRAFDAIEAAIKDVPTVPNVDGNPADPPSLPTDRVQFDQMGLNNGTAEVVTSQSEAAAPGTLVPNPLEDKGKGQEPTDAGNHSRVGRATNTRRLQMTSQNQRTTKKSDHNDLNTL
ncbi:hypothetical protein FS837_001314 [Tulasnella sp. UAMH 9824]|nr:hypothetical protein FS837_001314 [Tulasnella sp. UAMH 9824]